MDRSLDRSIARPKHLGVRISNYNPQDLFRGFEFRLTNLLRNYLGGSNFELLVGAILICRLSEFRISFCRNYDRTFLLFQGVLGRATGGLEI